MPIPSKCEIRQSTGNPDRLSISSGPVWGTRADPHGTHDCGSLFLELFFESLTPLGTIVEAGNDGKIERIPRDLNWTVYKEAETEHGRFLSRKIKLKEHQQRAAELLGSVLRQKPQY